ncbi:MAG TPA: hypothetical protein VFA14_06155 [Herbaspirillum sp.]|nr:hypothetical protein [Herbaspirillum sp.]
MTLSTLFGTAPFLMMTGGSNTLLLDACSHLSATVSTAAFAGRKTIASRQNLRYRYSYRLPYRNTHRNKLPAMRKNMAYFFISSFSAPEP